MALRRTRPALPDEARAVLALAAGERPSVAALAGDGSWWVATRAALHVVRPVDGEGWSSERLAWEDVDSAGWDRDAERLVVERVADFGAAVPRTSGSFAEPGRLLEMVRERVTASIVASRTVRVAAGRDVTVLARRSPAERGDVVMSYRLDVGLDPADPAVVDAMAEGTEALLGDLGLPSTG